MNKRIYIVALLLGIIGLLFSFQARANEGFNNVSSLDVVKPAKVRQAEIEKAFTLAKEQNKFVFIDLQASWCMPCKRMKKEVLSDPAIKEILKDNFITIVLDIDNDKLPSLNNCPVINSVPTFLFIEPQTRTVIHTCGGYFPVPEFAKQLARALSENTVVKQKERLLNQDPSTYDFTKISNLLSDLQNMGYTEDYGQIINKLSRNLEPANFTTVASFKFFEKYLNDPLLYSFKSFVEVKDKMNKLVGEEKVTNTLDSKATGYILYVIESNENISLEDLDYIKTLISSNKGKLYLSLFDVLCKTSKDNFKELNSFMKSILDSSDSFSDKKEIFNAIVNSRMISHIGDKGIKMIEKNLRKLQSQSSYRQEAVDVMLIRRELYMNFGCTAKAKEINKTIGLVINHKADWK